MFLEPPLPTRHGHSPRTGWVETVCGSMFSGKTEELIRRLKRALIAGQTVLVFKPALDRRYAEDAVVSHDRNALDSHPVACAADILKRCEEADVVGVDEAQFFDDELPEVCAALAERGKRVIVSGLDMDYEGRPFGAMPQLMATSEFVTKLHAVCARCGEAASFSFRTANSGEKVLLGEAESYEPRCRNCFSEGMREKGREAFAHARKP